MSVAKKAVVPGKRVRSPFSFGRRFLVIMLPAQSSGEGESFRNESRGEVSELGEALMSE